VTAALCGTCPACLDAIQLAALAASPYVTFGPDHVKASEETAQ
jgi:hypothetical protein